MADFRLKIDTLTLNRLNPFYFVLNRNMEIEQCGQSFQKWLQVEKGDRIEQVFSIYQPAGIPLVFDAIAACNGKLIVLDTLDGKNRWKGQPEYLADEHLILFIGYPSLNSMEDLLAKNLSAEDFAIGNPMVEMLQMQQSQKNLEAQLVINEKRYRDLYNYSQALICTHDLSGKLLSVNPTICETLGYSSEEMIGKLITDFLPPENNETFKERYLDVIVKEGRSKGIFPVISKDGERLSLLYQNYKVEEAGMDSYVIGFSQDITDRIKIEEALQIAKDEVENASRAKQSFLANMSHEIRTPMNGILGIGSLLYKTNLTPKQREFTKLIIESGNNLLHIVNDILDLSKLDSGHFNLESTPFELADKILSTLQAFHFKAEDKGIDLCFNNKLKKNLVIEGDPYRFGQVLNNLLSNALKFTSEGSITVTAEQLTTTQPAMFQISVADTGIGISKESLPTIFEQFVQAGADITRKYGGTGLGLTISKNLVEMQGGSIHVESKLNKGSTFTVRIPYKLSSESILKKELRKSGGVKSMERKRILVAEDVPANQLIAKHILKSWGHVVTIADNGRDVLRLLEKNNYDLVLMDIHMPEMNGVVTTREIRKLTNSKKANIPIIAVTAAAFKDETERYLEAGMNDFITKPYTEEKLFEVIRRVLRMVSTDPKPDSESRSIIPDAAKEKLYDLSNLLQFGEDDPNFIKDIITLFITNGRQDLNSLQAAITAGEIQEVFQVAHRMKSSLNTMGIHSIETAIKRIDHCSRHNENVEEIPALYGQVEKTMLTVFDQLMEDFGIVC